MLWLYNFLKVTVTTLVSFLEPPLFQNSSTKNQCKSYFKIAGRPYALLHGGCRGVRLHGTSTTIAAECGVRARGIVYYNRYPPSTYLLIKRTSIDSYTHWIRRKLRKAIKALVFANRPCTSAWSSCDWLQPTRKNRGQIFFRESYELKSNFQGFYFHRYATFPHTIHIQF